MKMWGFILAIFIFALLTTALNDAGLVTVNEVNDFNTANITKSSSTVKEVLTSDYAGSEEKWYMSLPGADLMIIVAQMFSALYESLKITIHVRPTLLSYGVPESLATLFQLVITMMESIFIFQVWRRFKIEN